MVSDSLLTILSPVAFGSLSDFHIFIPLLICYRRFLFQGRRAGIIASIGTVVGRIAFLACTMDLDDTIVIFHTVFGEPFFASPQYVVEPFLQLLGLILTYRVITFWRRPKLSWGMTGGELDWGSEAPVLVTRD